MPSFTAIVSVLAVASVALASPAATCTPSLGGRTVRIVDNDVEWSALVATVGTEVIARPTVTRPLGAQYHVEQTGSTPGSFFIKDVRDTSNSLVVGVDADNTLELETLSSSNPQNWSITCGSCTEASTLPSGTTAASSCSIQQTSSGKCVDIAGSAAKGDVLYVTDCTGGVSQRYNFVVV